MAKKKNVLNMPKFRINNELHGTYDVRIVGEDIESKIISLSEAAGWSCSGSSGKAGMCR